MFHCFVVIQRCTSVQEILTGSGLELSIDENEDYVSCVECCEGKAPPGVGFFSIAGLIVEESVVPQLERFRNLKKNIVAHFTTTAEHSLIHVMTESEYSELKRIGLRISMIAYSIIYHGDSFRSFENRVCEEVASKVNIGNINHSMSFFRRFLVATDDVIRKRLQMFLNTPLKCTQKLPPICIKPDKFTKKGEANQAVIIRHPCLTNGVLFRETYVGHLPSDTSSTGQELTELLIQSVQSTVDYQPPSRLRDTFCGIACDGAYLNLNLDRHFAQQTEMPEQFLKEATRHDYAHKIELLDLHARDGLSWIRNLDRDIKTFMKDNKDYDRRVKIQEKCTETGVQFYCFVLYSDTRFAQYRHRTYFVFIVLHGVLYRYDFSTCIYLEQNIYFYSNIY